MLRRGREPIRRRARNVSANCEHLRVPSRPSATVVPVLFLTGGDCHESSPQPLVRCFLVAPIKTRLSCRPQGAHWSTNRVLTLVRRSPRIGCKGTSREVTRNVPQRKGLRMKGYIRPAVIATYSIAELCANAATCIQYTD